MNSSRLEEGSELIGAARAGERGALAVLYEEHGERLYQLVFRLTGSAADAEDVIQDLFLGLPYALRSYDGKGSFAAWLRTVATRTALMKLRRRRRRREVGFPLRMPLRSRGQPPAVDRVFLERLLDRLRERDRTVIILREVEGFSHAEIGKILGISEGASRQRLHRARLRLRRLAAELGEAT